MSLAIEGTKKYVYAGRLWGLQPRYLNVDGDLVTSSPKAICATIQSLSGLKCDEDSDLAEVIKMGRQRFYQRRFSSTQILWHGNEQVVRFKIAEPQSHRHLQVVLQCEDGSSLSYNIKPRDHSRLESREVEGQRYLRCEFKLPKELPIGRHQIISRFENTDSQESAWLLVSPKKLDGSEMGRQWGVFSPLYALRAHDDWGVGSFKELGQLLTEVEKRGGSFVALLPLLAAKSDNKDLDPSPYSPVTRLFWNEVYLDIPMAHKTLSALLQEDLDLEIDSKLETELMELREKAYVDFYSVYQLKKKYLERLMEEFFKFQGEQLSEWSHHLNEHPDIDAYAQYRARLSGRKGDEAYHKFVQFLIDQQLQQLKGEHKAGLYLDLPVGVSRESFDMEKFPGEFLLESNVGAPPDTLFSAGQNWGFCPFHPQGIREQGYQYFSKIMSQHFRYGKYLRIDHIMGFHRIYTVPEGFENKDGIYVGFHSDEFYAAVMIQASRYGGVVIGEDLGTVPKIVREKLSEHGILRMWVLQMELGKSWDKTFTGIPEDAQASINTHDMSPFAGFLQNVDLEILTDLKLLDTDGAAEQRHQRAKLHQDWPYLKEDSEVSQETYQKLYQDIIQIFAASPARMVNVQIEDILGEIRPQNVPGTWKEYPNWRRKMTLTIHELAEEPFVNEVLNNLNDTLQSKDKQ